MVIVVSDRMGVSIRKPTVVLDGLERIIDVVLAKGGNRALVSYFGDRHELCARQPDIL